MSSTEVIGWFADIRLDDRQHVGGQGCRLGALQRAGSAVPAGFVVKTVAFERFMRTLERHSPLRSRVAALSGDDLSVASACCAEIRARMTAEALPADVLDEIASAPAALCGGEGHTPVAVRSSAT